MTELNFTDYDGKYLRLKIADYEKNILIFVWKNDYEQTIMKHY